MPKPKQRQPLTAPGYLVFRVGIIVEKNGGYAWSPSVDGIFMDGETVEEARQLAKWAAEDILRWSIEEGCPIEMKPTLDGARNGRPRGRRGAKYFTEEVVVEIERPVGRHTHQFHAIVSKQGKEWIGEVQELPAGKRRISFPVQLPPESVSGRSPRRSNLLFVKREGAACRPRTGVWPPKSGHISNTPS